MWFKVAEAACTQGEQGDQAPLRDEKDMSHVWKMSHDTFNLKKGLTLNSSQR